MHETWETFARHIQMALLGIPADHLLATVDAYNAAATADTTNFDATRTDGIQTAPGYAPPKSNWAGGGSSGGLGSVVMAG